MNTFCENSVPVAIGEFTLYTEKIRISCLKDIAEDMAFSGNIVYTKNIPKSTRIMLSGRIIPEKALSFAVFADSAIRNGDIMNILYKSLSLRLCRVVSCICENCDDGFYNVKLTLITPNQIEEAAFNGE
jgi:hypothetical protein